MYAARRMHGKNRRKHRQTQRWITISGVLLVLVIVITVAIVKWPAGNTDNQQNNVVVDPAFTTFTNHYLDLMKNLNSTQTKKQMSARMAKNQNDFCTGHQGLV